jgi:hypothetical protein
VSAEIVTTGFTAGPFKVEGSIFNGREQDENGATMDLAPLSSSSLRVGFALRKNWAMQSSVGRLNEPEAIVDTSQNGYLIETRLNLLHANHVYTRMELLDRDELFRTSEVDELDFRPPALDRFFGTIRRRSTCSCVGVQHRCTIEPWLEVVYGFRQSDRLVPPNACDRRVSRERAHCSGSTPDRSRRRAKGSREDTARRERSRRGRGAC